MSFKLVLAIGIGIIIAIIYLLGFWHTPAGAKSLKHEHAECNINASEKECEGDLVCTPFNEQSGNAKCEYPTPTVSPTCTPTPTQPIECEGEDCITPTPTISLTPSISPIVTVEPTAPPAGYGDGLSDHRSDGRSDGRSSSPQNSPFDNQPVGWK